MPAQPNDIDKVLEFAGEVNALLERGTLLISADAYCGLTKFGLFDRESGEHIDTTGCECVINSNGLTITSNLPAAPTSDGGLPAVIVPFCMFVERDPLCFESLSVLDFVLGARVDFPREGSVREKLEYANYVLESNRAIAKAGEYVGIGNLPAFTSSRRASTAAAREAISFTFPKSCCFIIPTTTTCLSAATA